MSGLIDAYLEELDRELSFDRRLSRRLHIEVEGHLRDAADHEGSEATAIARFGDPRPLAREYAAATITTRLRTVWLSGSVAVTATFLCMRLRTMLLAPSMVPGDLGRALALVDRAAFTAGVLIGVYAWRMTRTQGSAQGIGRVLTPLMSAMVALLISVGASMMRVLGADGGLTIVATTLLVELTAITGAAAQLRVLSRHARASSLSGSTAQHS